MVGFATKVRLKLSALRHRSWLNKCRQIEGWLKDREALGLFDIAQRLPAGAQILEIGSWKGKSTFVLATGLADGTIYALDPFNASGEPECKPAYDRHRGETPLLSQFQNNLGQHGLLHKVVVRQGCSREFAGQFHDLDFLFIDGDHSQEGCVFDYETYAPAVKPHGYLAFHDYDAKRPDLGPTWTVEMLVKPSGDWRFIRQLDSLIIFQRKW